MGGFTCSICTDELREELVTSRACGHIFHSACLYQWLERKKSCPNCSKKCIRRDVVPLFPGNWEDDAADPVPPPSTGAPGAPPGISERDVQLLRKEKTALTQKVAAMGYQIERLTTDLKTEEKSVQKLTKQASQMRDKLVDTVSNYHSLERRMHEKDKALATTKKTVAAQNLVIAQAELEQQVNEEDKFDASTWRSSSSYTQGISNQDLLDVQQRALASLNRKISTMKTNTRQLMTEVAQLTASKSRHSEKREFYKRLATDTAASRDSLQEELAELRTRNKLVEKERDLLSKELTVAKTRLASQQPDTAQNGPAVDQVDIPRKSRRERARGGDYIDDDASQSSIESAVLLDISKDESLLVDTSGIDLDMTTGSEPSPVHNASRPSTTHRPTLTKKEDDPVDERSEGIKRILAEDGAVNSSFGFSRFPTQSNTKRRRVASSGFMGLGVDKSVSRGAFVSRGHDGRGGRATTIHTAVKARPQSTKPVGKAVGKQPPLSIAKFFANQRAAGSRGIRDRMPSFQ